ncbi:MAG: hypothetical protein L6R28_12690 [Planctomycetes bacterium]|nr:hypothetical protein [Planctomycetota bacterium]
MGSHAVRPSRGKRNSSPENELELRIAEARKQKEFRRRVRGQDYEQVTVILDRALYLELDKQLAEISIHGGGVKLSRSMLIRALVRRFLRNLDGDGTSSGRKAKGAGSEKGFTLKGLFTPDPRSSEELEMVEAALVERLA